MVNEVERLARKEHREALARTKEVARVIKSLVGNVAVTCEVCCPVCSVVVDYEGFSIRCDQCDRWVHGRCAAIDPSRAWRAIHVLQYYCPPCCTQLGLEVIYRGPRKRDHTHRRSPPGGAKRQKPT